MSIEDQWNALSDKEKLERLEPRVQLAVVLMAKMRDILLEENLMTEFINEGLDQLNLKK